jgi:hypothetical protein
MTINILGIIEEYKITIRVPTNVLMMGIVMENLL